MSRNVFLSFLGKTAYTPTRYVSQAGEEETVEPLHFVQETIARKYCQRFGSEDRLYILTTQGALHNWNETEHPGWDGKKKSYEPLQSRLSKLNLQCRAENVLIPDGKSTPEIWQIFDIIFSLLQENDKVILDITHGFRSLPMLNIVLISYAKLLKDIRVEGIYYGNIEAAYVKNGSSYAPLWDLKAFEVLNEWTSSATIFLKTGNSKQLSSLIEELGLTRISENLDKFTEMTYLNRGLDIFNGNVMLQLSGDLTVDKWPEVTGISALKPIVEKVKDKFRGYSSDSSYNGFIAVKWCIENGLVQQAATLLEEFITTFVLVEIGQTDALRHIKKRSTVAAALTIGDSTHFDFEPMPKEPEQRQSAQDLINWQHLYVPLIRQLPYKKKIGKVIGELKKSVRDDVNHGGFRPNPREASDIRASIKKRYRETKKLISELKGVELPDLTEE